MQVFTRCVNYCKRSRCCNRLSGSWFHSTARKEKHSNQTNTSKQQNHKKQTRKSPSQICFVREQKTQNQQQKRGQAQQKTAKSAVDRLHSSRKAGVKKDNTATSCTNASQKRPTRNKNQTNSQLSKWIGETTWW